MLKLLLVEDELLVRMGLKTAIPWEQLGFQIVGEAENGLKALELAREKLPDLVLTDIKMPKMDGIALIKALKKELPRIKVIVLSCYQDFDLVREAMQLGALDYIPKLSMQPEDLIKVFTKVKCGLEEDQDAPGFTGVGDSYLNIYEMRSLFFNGLLKKDGPSPEPITPPKVLRVSLPDHGEMGVICLGIDDAKSIRGDHTQDLSSSRDSLLSVVDEFIEIKGWSGNIFNCEGRYGLIIGAGNKNPNISMRQLQEFCVQLMNEIQQYLNLSVSFGIGPVIDDFSHFRTAFLKAAEALEFRLYNGKGSINIYQNIGETKDDVYSWPTEKALRELVEDGKITQAKTLIFEIITQIEANGKIAPSKVKRELIEILNTLSSLMKQYGGELEDLMDLGGMDPYRSLEGTDTLIEIQDWFERFLNQYGGALSDLKVRRFGREISKSLEYINQHYADDLTLTEIAGYIGLNETYFSHLFKKTTGVNFTDYVNSLRIDKAKEILRTEDYSIYQVAEKVGYTNISYFSRIFKQWVGVGPFEYKKSSKNSDRNSKDSYN